MTDPLLIVVVHRFLVTRSIATTDKRVLVVVVIAQLSALDFLRLGLRLNLRQVKIFFKPL